MNENIPNITFNNNSCTRDFKILPLKKFFENKEIIHGIYEPYRIKFYQMIFISKGEGSHMVDFQKVPLKKGVLFFSSPNQIQAFEKPNSYDGYLCIFTEEFLNREFLKVANRHVIDNLYFKNITKALVLEDSSLEIYFELLLKEFELSKVSLEESIISSLLNCILQKSKDHFSITTEDNKRSELFNAFKKTLMTNFRDINTVEEYAKILKISPKHLNIICKDITGLTTKAFIDKFKIVEIKRYLAATTLPINEISTNMGYWEVSNFNKFFKKHTQLTPKAFRSVQKLSL